ncbi:MAG: YihA family ribosome biogenesis GTP-binding protein [Epsilonproteobacteria bacterium]|nr:YihA family ribosome biogenesis GTP-binding protein [Campylobacterota bacterium]
MIKIVKADFLTSATSIKDSVSEGISEAVFLGRSNVGKSSFINSLTDRKNLAKSSSTPGKTKLINFFDITFMDDETKEKYIARFIDLPGFGYAKASKDQKKIWQKNLTEFIEKRKSIRLFIFLRDARHFELPIDLEVEKFLENLKRKDQKIIQIFTKSDKLKQKDISALKKKYPDAILVSNLKKKNIDKAREEIFKGLFS